MSRTSSCLLITINRTEYPSMEVMLDYTKKLLSPVGYIISREYGKETNKEHYHIFVELQIAKRPDNVARSFNTQYLKWFKDNKDTNKVNVVAYNCPDVDPVQYGYGYCFKEVEDYETDYLSNRGNKYLEECRQYYKENRQKVDAYKQKLRQRPEGVLTVAKVKEDFIHWYVKAKEFHTMSREYPMSDLDNPVLRSFIRQYDRPMDVLLMSDKLKFKDWIPAAEIWMEICAAEEDCGDS